MAISLEVFMLSFIAVMVSGVACELNMTSSSQTTPSGSSSALFDSDNSTCAEFSGRGHTDLLVELPEPVAWSTSVSLLGTDLLCGAHEQGRLYVVPSTTLEPMGPVSSCRPMIESKMGNFDVCSFSCQNYADASESTALEAIRIIRKPFNISRGDWTLCGLYARAPAACPPGWDFDLSVSKCYLVVTTAMSWSSAESHCSSLYSGAHLVDVQTEEENLAVAKYFILSNTYWSSGHLTSGSSLSDFTWRNNESLTWTKWFSSTEYSANKNCVQLHGSNAHWHPYTCSANFRFICELDAEF